MSVSGPETTQLFFHNPSQYGTYLDAMGEYSISISQRFWGDISGEAEHFSDPVKWCRKTFSSAPWQLLYMEHDVAALYDNTATSIHSAPVAAWPIFNFFVQRIDDLIYLLENPWGTSKEHLTADVPVRRRPVYRQPHRIVVAGIPAPGTPEYGSLSAFLRWAKTNFDVEFIVHTSHTFVDGMNMGAWGVTYNVKAPLNNGRTVTQYGTSVLFSDAPSMELHADSFREVGFEPEDLAVTSGETISSYTKGEQHKYAIAAARFAAYYWHHRGAPGPGNHRSQRPDVSDEATLEDFIAEVVRKKLQAERAPRGTS